ATRILLINGQLNLAPGGEKALTVRLFIVGSGGAIDLADNVMIVDSLGTPSVAQVQDVLTSGYAGGAWNGTGINSSVAAADSSHFTTLGFAAATDLFNTFPATFAGQSVSNTSVLIAYTLYGDADLDKTVTTIDFNLLATNFSQT